MKKTVTVLVLAAMMAFVLTACGGKSKDITVDVTKLCEDLQSTVTSGELASVSSDLQASTYFFDLTKVEESAAALSSGASACEVAVVKCKDSSYASEVKGLFETRVKNQSDLFADYNAPEVAKLDNALIRTSGNYTVLCVTDDTKKAEEILKEAGF